MPVTELHQTTYDRHACEIGIVHVGFGAFHRAHQAVFLDDYMEATRDLRWGIAAVNLRASESEGFTKAASGIAANGYPLKSIAPDGTSAYRLVRPHLAFVDAAQDVDAALDLIARPGVHAVSMTVTESGYALRDDWTLDRTAPEIAAELAGGPVCTIYGFLAAGLARRMEATGAPVTLLCCDNIRDNGNVLRRALLDYLSAREQDNLGAWVQANVTFPCSMVDRITPRTTDALRTEVAACFPSLTAAPIHAEAFLQWVLQDAFAAEMPDLTKVGVQVVANVEPYEEAKIRILNGGHTGLAYLGALAGHDTFDQAMRDPALLAHFDHWERDEVLVGLDGLIPFDTAEYLAEIAARFANAGIADQLERICMDGWSKMGIYIRPTLAACLEKGMTPDAGYDCAASWVVYARRVADGRCAIPYHEPFRERLDPLLLPGREADLAAEPQLWGDLPARYPGFVTGLVAAIQRMEDQWQD